MSGPTQLECNWVFKSVMFYLIFEILYLVSNASLYAQTSQELVLDFKDDGHETVESGYYEPKEKIFKNPVLASGLTQGTDAINHAIDTFMESVFYSLLNNQISIPMNDQFSMQVNLNRDVYDAPDGMYVVVDRFSLGPQFLQQLGTIKDVPINLGAKTGFSFLDIQLRSDAIRLKEKEDLTFFRYAVNNWFGILPVLEAILPPSFNLNAMYDPVKRLEITSLVPTTLENVAKIPTGAIRSYLTSGGVELGIDWAGFMGSKIEDIKSKLSGIGLNLPFSVFFEGEHRISVLKRAENIVWVSVNNTREVGYRFNGLFGTTFFLIRNTIPYWKGFPVNFFPFDIRFEQAFAKLYGQIFEFDLAQEAARRYYLTAVKGDFTDATKQAQIERDTSTETGVKYFFTKKENSTTFRNDISHNYALWKKVRNNSDYVSDIHIQEPEGETVVLETGKNWIHEWSDVFAGKEENKWQGIGVIKVDETEDKSGEISFKISQQKNPYYILMNYVVNDKYVEAEEYQAYMQQLKAFMFMPMPDIPTIQVRDDDAVTNFRMQNFFQFDAVTDSHLHVTPTHLGRLRFDASLLLTSDHIDQIAHRPEADLYRVLTESFNGEKSIWNNASYRDSVARNFYHWTSILFYPFRTLTNSEFLADRLREVDTIVEALQLFKNDRDALSRRDAMKKLFETSYPLELAHALLQLTDESTVSRSVSFSAESKGGGSVGAKFKFDTLGHMKISAPTKAQRVDRYENVREKETQFIPGSLKMKRSKSSIALLGLTVDPDYAKPQLTLRVQARSIEPFKNALVFVQIEQSGKLNLGKLKLADAVIAIKPSFPKHGFLNQSEFEIEINKPDTPLSGFILDQALKFGGDFRVGVSVAQDSASWSQERFIEFSYRDGTLKGIKPD